MTVLVVLLSVGLSLIAVAGLLMLRQAHTPAPPPPAIPQPARLWRSGAPDRLAEDIAALRRSMHEPEAESAEAAFWAGTDFADTLPCKPAPAAGRSALAWAPTQPRGDLRVILNF